MTDEQTTKFEPVPHRGKKDTTYRTTDRDGNQVVLTTGDDGAIWPQNDAEQEILQGFGLKVHRKALRAAQDDGGDADYKAAGPDVPDDDDDDADEPDAPFGATAIAESADFTGTDQSTDQPSEVTGDTAGQQED